MLKVFSPTALLTFFLLLPRPASAIDFDGNGSADLIFQNTIDYQVQIWLMSGKNRIGIINGYEEGSWKYKYCMEIFPYVTIPGSTRWFSFIYSDVDNPNHIKLTFSRITPNQRLADDYAAIYVLQTSMELLTPIKTSTTTTVNPLPYGGAPGYNPSVRFISSAIDSTSSFHHAAYFQVGQNYTPIFSGYNWSGQPTFEQPAICPCLEGPNLELMHIASYYNPNNMRELILDLAPNSQLFLQELNGSPDPSWPYAHYYNAGICTNPSQEEVPYLEPYSQRGKVFYRSWSNIGFPSTDPNYTPKTMADLNLDGNADIVFQKNTFTNGDSNVLKVWRLGQYVRNDGIVSGTTPVLAIEYLSPSSPSSGYQLVGP